MQRLTESIERKWLHMILDVGGTLRWVRPGERTKLRRGHGHRTTATQYIVDAHAEPIEHLGIGLVQRFHPRNLENQPQLQVVVQIGAYPRLVEDDRNPKTRQLRRRPHAGKHHNMRRTDCAGGKYHFTAALGTPQLAVLAPAYRRRSLSIQFHRFDKAAGFEPEVRPVQDRLQESACGRPASAAFLVHVKIANAFVIAGIEILDRRDSVLVCCSAERVENLPVETRVLHAPLAADAMMLAFEKVIDMLTKIGTHVIPGPAWQAKLAPVVVVA